MDKVQAGSKIKMGLRGIFEPQIYTVADIIERRVDCIIFNIYINPDCGKATMRMVARDDGRSGCVKVVEA